jgi:hypothetical protein
MRLGRDVVGINPKFFQESSAIKDIIVGFSGFPLHRR